MPTLYLAEHLFDPHSTPVSLQGHRQASQMGFRKTYTMCVSERIAEEKRCGRLLHEKRRWKPPANRADPVDLVIESSRGRVEELLPIRYGRRLVSSFTFFRGAAAIMAYDLSHTPAAGLSILVDGDWEERE
jgi:hypothetical protein